MEKMNIDPMQYEFFKALQNWYETVEVPKTKKELDKALAFNGQISDTRISEIQERLRKNEEAASELSQIIIEYVPDDSLRDKWLSEKRKMAIELEQLREKVKTISKDLLPENRDSQPSVMASNEEIRLQIDRLICRIKEIEGLLYYQKTQSTYQFVIPYSLVTIRFLKTNNTRKVMITTPVEINAEKNYISAESPLGKAILFKKAGERVSFKNPSGVQTEIEIEEIDMNPKRVDEKE